MPELKVGDVVPDLAGIDQNGATVRLADLRGKFVVLFFYPKDGTSVCTREVCQFRDAYEDFLADGAVVIGVSSDSEASHRKFGEQQRVPYHLISDSSGAWRKGMGVPNTMWILPGRVTYLIDREGRIQNIVNAMFDTDRHVNETRRRLQELKAASQA
jgi:peroxiredoxin Q/BCP